jgi:hypothetical protein
MRTYLFAGLVLAAAAETLGAQSGPPSSPSPAPPTARTITLVGCVQTDTAKPEWFTLSDKSTGTTYRLTGANVRAYVWRNVRIVGGFVPSPNIAAQAGAIDQTKAAMAHQGANPPGTGNIGPLEFSVTRVRRLTGSCAPKPVR